MSVVETVASGINTAAYIKTTIEVGENNINFAKNQVKADNQKNGIYVTFDGKDNKLTIYKDNGGDDDEIGSYDAYNNVDSRSQGKWEDGTYEMEDQTSRKTHGDAIDKKGILEDSEDGMYGVGGIYRAKPFREKGGDKLYRDGMAIHAGRLHSSNGKNKPLNTRVTNGCIRTTPEAMIAIDDAIAKYGRFKKLIVKNNLSQTRVMGANKKIKRTANSKFKVKSIPEFMKDLYNLMFKK